MGNKQHLLFPTNLCIAKGICSNGFLKDYLVLLRRGISFWLLQWKKLCSWEMSLLLPFPNFSTEITVCTWNSSLTIKFLIISEQEHEKEVGLEISGYKYQIFKQSIVRFKKWCNEIVVGQGGKESIMHG